MAPSCVNVGLTKINNNMRKRNVANVSWEFIARLKTAPLPQCALAAVVGINAAQLSRIVRKREMVRYLDERCVRLGGLVGLKPAECFEPPSGQAIGTA